MEVREAATVILVREGPAGRPQVLLLQRNLRSDFAAGAHVFPGGAVEAGDRCRLVEARCVGRDDAGCSAELGLARGGLAAWVAAVRECFEEAGILLAHRRGASGAVSFADRDVAERFAAHRAALNGGRPFSELLAEEDLVVDACRVHYVSHWVTPEGATRRYDTRFFLAAAPPEQVAVQDDGETVASLWIEPRDALGRHHQGGLHLLLPTIRNLELLAPLATLGEVLVWAGAPRQVDTIRPRIVPDGDRVRILLPGDDGYDDTPSRASP